MNFPLSHYRTHILRLSLPGARPNPPEGILSRDGSMPRLGEMALALPADLIVRAHFRAVTGSRMLLHVQALVFSAHHFPARRQQLYECGFAVAPLLQKPPLPAGCNH